LYPIYYDLNLPQRLQEGKYAVLTRRKEGFIRCWRLGPRHEAHTRASPDVHFASALVDVLIHTARWTVGEL
jgi:hypothetical protein